MILELVSVLREQLEAERKRGDRLELLLSRVPEEPKETKLAPVIPGRRTWSEISRELTKKDRDRAKAMLEEVEQEIENAR